MKGENRFYLLIFFTVCYFLLVFRPVLKISSSYQKNFQAQTSSDMKWQEFLKELDSRETQLSEVRAAFLEKDKHSDFGYRMSVLCEKSGLDNTETGYSERRDGKAVSTVRFIITVSGEYRKIREFLYRMECDFPYAVIDSIDHLEDSGEKSAVRLKFSGVLLLKS